MVVGIVLQYFVGFSGDQLALLLPFVVVVDFVVVVVCGSICIVIGLRLCGGVLRHFIGIGLRRPLSRIAGARRGRSESGGTMVG